MIHRCAFQIRELEEEKNLSFKHERGISNLVAEIKLEEELGEDTSALRQELQNLYNQVQLLLASAQTLR